MVEIVVKPKYAVGASLGQDCRDAAVQVLRRDPTAPTKVLISFKGVSETNASFVKATLLYFFNCGRLFALGTQSDSVADDAPIPLNCFPAVTECAQQVLAEIEEVFFLRQLPFLQVDTLSKDVWLKSNIRGYLDSSLVQTFRALANERDGVTAALLRQTSSERVAGTAWNNRLEAMHVLRLIERFRFGREWKYKALSNETNLWVSGTSNRKRNATN